MKEILYKLKSKQWLEKSEIFAPMRKPNLKSIMASRGTRSSANNGGQ